jgi:hypothetical protein
MYENEKVRYVEINPVMWGGATTDNAGGGEFNYDIV